MNTERALLSKVFYPFTELNTRGHEIQIIVNCNTIMENAKSIIRFCDHQSIGIVGVTKGCCGNPFVAQAMVLGGIEMLADSRLEHLYKIRKFGISVPLMLIRLPNPNEASQVVQVADVSINSESSTISALGEAAKALGIIHKIILMVDVGDRREGILPKDALSMVRSILLTPNIELLGLGTTTSCLNGIYPSYENLKILVDIADSIEKEFNVPIKVLSGGQTASLNLIDNNQIPDRINQLRVGEAILLGTNEIWETEPPYLYQDAIRITAEVIELKTKPSAPEGKIGKDAFGRIPKGIDQGPRLRAIVAMGEIDTYVDGLTPEHPNMKIVAASSDHMVVDITELPYAVRVGDTITFRPSYSAMAVSMASSTVEKIINPAQQ